MANILVKTHRPNQSDALIKILPDQQQVPVIKASANSQYQLINEATGLAPAKAIIRKVGNDMEISFDEDSRETELIIEGYYRYPNQTIVGQTAGGEFRNYLPISNDNIAYTDPFTTATNGPTLLTQASHSPIWTALLENPWGLALGLAPIAIYAAQKSSSDDEDDSKASNNKAPVLTVTQIAGFESKDTEAKAGAIVAKYTTSDADKDKVTVKLSNKTHFALDDKGNVTLTQKGADLLAKGDSLPTFTLIPNDGKTDGNKASINPMVNSKLTVTVSDLHDFIEDDAGTKKGAIVANYKIEGDDSSKATITLSDTVNYALDDKGHIVLTEKGAALANSGKELPAVMLTPQLAGQAGKPASVDPKVTLVNDAPVLTVTETTVFVQTDKNIKAGNIVAKYTTSDEDGNEVQVSLSDTEHYKLDNKGNVLLTQKGVDLISSGAELPPFKLTPNDSIVNGTPVLVGPEINSAPVLTVTKTHDLTKAEGEVKAGAIVASFKTTDVDSTEITVKLSDETNYALDGKGNVILTEKGAALINADKTLPEFILTPNDAAQDGTDVTVNPNQPTTADTQASSFMLETVDTLVMNQLLDLNEINSAVSYPDSAEVEIINFSKPDILEIGLKDIFADANAKLYSTDAVEKATAQYDLIENMANEDSQIGDVASDLYSPTIMINPAEMETLQAII